MSKTKADIGLIGLGVMGQNLALNMENHGFTLAVHNRGPESVENFINGIGKNKKFIGCADFVDFVNSIKRPRKIMMMVKAGIVVIAILLRTNAKTIN
jgi:6-phosphogluconate dehydrogenase